MIYGWMRSRVRSKRQPPSTVSCGDTFFGPFFFFLCWWLRTENIPKPKFCLILHAACMHAFVLCRSRSQAVASEKHTGYIIASRHRVCRRILGHRYSITTVHCSVVGRCRKYQYCQTKQS
ncbi:unnamed protein product [Laminaria digitata]